MKTSNFIIEKCIVLKQLFIWQKMTKEEKADFIATKSEIIADNKITSLCQKYL